MRTSRSTRGREWGGDNSLPPPPNVGIFLEIKGQEHLFFAWVSKFFVGNLPKTLSPFAPFLYDSDNFITSSASKSQKKTTTEKMTVGSIDMLDKKMEKERGVKFWKEFSKRMTPGYTKIWPLVDLCGEYSCELRNIRLCTFSAIPLVHTTSKLRNFIFLRNPFFYVDFSIFSV